MADEFQTSGNWWDSSRPASRYEAAAAGTASPPSSALNGLGIGGFGWSNSAAENNNNTNLMVDMKSRASMDSASVSGNSPMAFHDGGKLQHSDNSAAGDANLHLMGLGLSNSPTLDWNHALFRGEKAAQEGSFRAILQDGMAGPNPGFQQEQIQWQREKLFHGHNDHHHSNTTTTTNSRGFSLDQSSQFSPQYSSGDSTVTCQGLAGQPSFQGGGGDSAALYGSPSVILQGLFGPDGTAAASFGLNSSDLLGNSSNWASGNSNASSTNPNKLPQFLRSTNSPPKPSPAFGGANNSHLQFSNNAAFWNAPEAAAMKDARTAAAAGFFPALQPQFPTASFEEKPKNISEVRDSGSVAKKSGNEAASNKRPRNDQTTSTLPAFKVRKEKMGDRITALQQLVSPFGKTDTASVLSEAIEYIKFLHDQVSVLSTPYMKSGAATQHHQINSEKSKDPEDPKQDLRSRGLCLVPVSSTFPVTHETTVDFWTPTFGGTFR